MQERQIAHIADVYGFLVEGIEITTLHSELMLILSRQVEGAYVLPVG